MREGGKRGGGIITFSESVVVLLHDLDVYWIVCGVPPRTPLFTHLRNCLALAQISLRCASTPLLFTVSRITSHLRLGLGEYRRCFCSINHSPLAPEILGMRNSTSQEARCYGKIDLFFFYLLQCTRLRWNPVRLHKMLLIVARVVVLDRYCWSLLLHWKVYFGGGVRWDRWVNSVTSQLTVITSSLNRVTRYLMCYYATTIELNYD